MRIIKLIYRRIPVFHMRNCGILLFLFLYFAANSQQQQGILLGEASWRAVTVQKNPESLPVISKTSPVTKITAKDKTTQLVGVPIDPGTVTIHTGPTKPVVQAITITGKKLPPPVIIPAPALLVRDNARYDISYTDGKHGLVSNTAMDFAEDDEHNIWIASDKGLIRYDGYHYYLYEQNLFFPNMPDISLAFDNQKRLWWVSDNGAFFFRNDSMFTIKSPEINFSAIQCKRVIKDAANRIWISTKKNGALCIKNDVVEIYDQRCGLPGNYIETTFIDKKGNIYLGCRNYGFVLIEKDKMRMFFSRSKKMKYNIIVSFCEDEEGIWAGCFLSGIMHMGTKDTTHYSISGRFNESVYSIIKANNGIWFSVYGHGVFFNYKNELLPINEKNGLLNNFNYLMFEDSFHNLWISNIGGFSRLNDMRFYYKPYNNPLIGNVKNFIPDPARGGKWIITFSKNLIFQKGDNCTAFTYTNPDGLQPYSYPTDGVLNKDGSLWMGSYAEGIVHVTDQNFTEYKYSDFTDHGIIVSVKKDAEGRVWFCPTKYGLITYAHDKFSRYTNKTGLLSDEVTNLFADKAQTMYWSFTEGFQRKKGNTIETFYIGNRVFKDQVNGFWDIDAETYLLGTYHTGLLLVKRNQVIQLPNTNSTKNIRSVIMDGHQQIWIKTDKSIESFKIQENRFTDHHIYEITRDGFLTEGDYSFIDERGNPNWSSGNDKLVYDPTTGTQNKALPILGFKDVYIDSQALSSNKDISILPNQKININYTTIYWGRENNLQLKYLLISNQQDTTERTVQNNGNIIISDVLPGNYRILLKATDNNQTFFSKPINITVRNFWYNTWLFRIIFSVLIISGIVMYFRQKSRRQTIMNEVLKIKVREQTEVIEKEKNSLLQSYQTIDLQNKEKDVLIDEINHRVKNNLQFIAAILELQLDSQESENVIHALSGTSRRIKAMSLVHELLYNKQEQKGLSMRAYIQQLVDNLSEMAVHDSSPVNIEMDIDDLVMDSKTALALGMIISELVSNSFKHAFKNIAEPEVRIELKYDNNTEMYKLKVMDNGTGYLEDSVVHKGLGSNLVNIFSRQLDGEYHLYTNGCFSYELNFKISYL